MNVIGDSGLNTIQGWLDGLARRREAIAGNIANIDTPGYRRQEVVFEDELRRMVGTTSSSLATTHPRHLGAGGGQTGRLGADPAQALVSSRRDGNTVDIDQEMVLLAETQMRYQAASTALTSKLSLIREALRTV